ncbi:MAG: pyridoxamine 5'-phosphate oxidase family protein [Chitinophagaceae bacterium]|nr:pyridoxamine 5'-phosphate oxidase family protein [Chitinophagaceae bacterium]
MGKVFDHIPEAQVKFIQEQKMFFVATAPLNKDFHVNVSPKGLDTFCVINSHQVAYIDFVGSGNETSAHLLENGRITFMFCSFDKAPMILRLYGLGKVVLPHTGDWQTFAPYFKDYPQARQIIVADISRVQTSCGYGIPMYDYKADRTTLLDWAETKGDETLTKYKEEKNSRSIDGMMTHFGERHTG